MTIASPVVAASAAAKEEPMLDVMRHIQLEIPCSVCADSYSVSADTVRESQRLLAEGCPGTSSYECPPLFFATLLPAEALAHLVGALQEVERSALSRGSTAIWVEEPVLHASNPLPAAAREATRTCAAIARWEDDGGAPSPQERP